MRPPRLGFLRNGRTYAVAHGDRLEIRSFGQGQVRSWPLADAAVAAVGDELWIVSGDPPVLARWAFAEPAPSTARAAGVVLPGLPAGELFGSPLSRVTAAWNGTVPVAIVAGPTTATGEVIERSDLVVPLTASSWLDVLGSSISLRGSLHAGPVRGLPGGAAAAGALHGRAPETWRCQLPDGASVRDAAPLLDGSRIAVVADLDDGRRAFVVSTHDGEIQRTLACPGDAVRLVPSRGKLAVADGTRIALIDLLSGESSAEWRSPEPVLELAISHDASHIVVAHAGGIAEIVGVPAAPEPRPSPAPPPGGRPGSPPQAADPFSVPLAGLWPRQGRPLPSTADSARVLELHTRFIAALAVHAIARAWRSGRLNRAPDELPHLTEVRGLMGETGETGHAGEAADGARVATAELAAAQARIETSHAELLEAVHALGDHHAPLTRLAIEFALSPVATQILMIAGAPILHGDIARLYRILADDPARPLLDVQLVPQLLHGRASRAEILRELDREAPLIRFGMLELTGTAPFSQIAIHPTVVRRLRAVALDAGLDPGVQLVPPPRALAELHVPRAALLACLAALAGSGARPARLAVRGRTASGRRSVLAAIAARAGRELAAIDAGVQHRDPVADLAGLRGRLRDAMLRGWLPCVVGLDPATRDPALRHGIAAVLDEHPGPLALRLDPGRDPIAQRAVVLDLPRPTEAERAELWTRALARNGLATERVPERVAGARVGPGVIEQVVAAAAKRPHGEPVAAELAAALRRHTESRLAPLADRVARLPGWDDVVVPERVADSVRALIGSIRQRRRVFDDWGFDRTGHAPGAIAALQGAPGTGKTLIAGVIARELGAELYRVEPARIAERPEDIDERLAAVLDAADDGPAIVVFEDAGPLLERLDLRRLDAFEGIALLAIDDRTALPRPIARRLASRIALPCPDAELREQLWQLHLPRVLPRDADVDLRALARHAMSGGSIRNAALRAAVLAAEAGTVVTQAHLERAIALELIDPDAHPRPDA